MVALLGVLFTIEADFAADEAKQRRGLQMLLESDRACLLVAESEAGVIGMCSGQVMISTAEGGPALVVEDVVIDQSFRGRGVGRMLMEALQSWAAARNVTRLQLLADRNNAPALDFYRRLGWQHTDLICLRTRR
ncbi:MAG: GNAT family N-acetyltransferase [Desulfobulbaceae bacterium]